VAKSEQGVAVRHPGSGQAHHRLDFSPHDGTEAVDGASDAGRFALLKGALREAFGAVGQKFEAGGTEIRFCAMKIPAVDPDHGLYGPRFPLDPGVACRHGRLSGTEDPGCPGFNPCG